MLSTYLEDLDLLVRTVKFALANLGKCELKGMHYGRQDADAAELGAKLFTCLQALSYLREYKPLPTADIKELVSYIATLIDLEQVALEPYNLYLRPLGYEVDYGVLFAGDSALALNENLLLLGSGLRTRALRLPSPYPSLPPESC